MCARLMPGDKCTSTGIFTPLQKSERGERREKRLNIAWPRDEGSGMMTRLHVWTLVYGNIECGNEMFIRCGFEGGTGGAREQGKGWDKH